MVQIRNRSHVGRRSFPDALWVTLHDRYVLCLFSPGVAQLLLLSTCGLLMLVYREEVSQMKAMKSILKRHVCAGSFGMAWRPHSMGTIS